MSDDVISVDQPIAEKPALEYKRAGTKMDFTYAEALATVGNASVDLFALQALLPHPIPRPDTSLAPGQMLLDGDSLNPAVNERFKMGRRQRPFRRFNPRKTSRRIVEKRRKTLAERDEPKPLGDGRASSCDIFGYGDHAYFKPLIDSLWMPNPVGSTFFSETVNRLSKDIRKAVEREKARLVARAIKTVAFEFVSGSTSNDLETEGRRTFEQRSFGANPATDEGEALTSFMNVTSLDGRELAVADMSKQSPVAASDYADLNQVSNMTLELALIMSASRICNDLLSEQAKDEKCWKPMSKERRQKHREAAKRVHDAREAQIDEALARGISMDVAFALPMPSFRGFGVAAGAKKQVRLGQPGYVRRPRGRPKGTTGTGKHQIAARLTAMKVDLR